jgi:hypothetical protein
MTFQAAVLCLATLIQMTIQAAVLCLVTLIQMTFQDTNSDDLSSCRVVPGNTNSDDLSSCLARFGPSGQEGVGQAVYQRKRRKRMPLQLTRHGCFCDMFSFIFWISA